MPQKTAEEFIKIFEKCIDFGDPKEHYNQLIELRGNIKDSNLLQFLFKILNALGSKERFIIIDMLRKKDCCVCELELLLDKSQGAVSRHLKILEDSNLIRGWKKGKFTHYSLIKPAFEKFLSQFKNWTVDTNNWFGELPKNIQGL